MNITIGSDHGAVELKDEVKMVLREFDGVHVKDVGTFGRDAVDYPDIAREVCADVTSGRADRGILLCGTGVGISIAANKIDGIRAALGGRVLGFGPAGEIVRAWMRTEFEGGRHMRRIEKIMALENKEA